MSKPKCGGCIAEVVRLGRPTAAAWAERNHKPGEAVAPLYVAGTCSVCGLEAPVAVYPDFPEFEEMRVKSGSKGWADRPLTRLEPIEDRGSPEYVLATIDNEGLRYALESYSSYDEVEDEEFHRLRKTYLSSLVAGRALEDYVRAAVKLNEERRKDA